MIAERVLTQIDPPLTLNGAEDVEKLVAKNSNITFCVLSTFHFARNTITQIVQKNIPGDILLAGVWRGGLAAYLQALLVDAGNTNRKLYLADTFSGFVDITDENPRDKKMLEYFKTLNAPSGSVAEVKETFTKLGLPLDNVVFLEGDIRYTTAGFSHDLSMLLIDMDFYKPTRDCLNNLYQNVNRGGIIYVDDYEIPEFECKDAVDEFIKVNSISAEIMFVNKWAIYWAKK